MSETPQILLAHHLKKLKLPTFLHEHEKIARLCAAENRDHTRFLLRLAELELIDREGGGSGAMCPIAHAIIRWDTPAVSKCDAGAKHRFYN